MTRILRLPLLAALAATLTFTAALRAAIPPAENLLPADTLFVVTAPDCAALRTALLRSPQALFWNDPAMKPFHDKFMAKWNEVIVAPLANDLGLNLSDFTDLPQGQFTFALTQNGWTGTGDQTPGWVLLLDAKDKSGLLKTNLAALQKKWNESGKPIHTETIRGVQFSVVPLSSNDIPASLSNLVPKRQPTSEIGKDTPPPAKPADLVIGQFDSLLIAGNSLQAVEPVVAHLTGGSAPALADNAVFAADKLAQFRGAPLYYGWFNAKTFFGVLAAIPQPQPDSDAPSPMPAFSWNKALAASGFMGLKSASFSCRNSYDGSEADFYLAVPEAERAGFLKMLAASTKDASAPLFVPADAVKFWRWRADGQKDWAALETMIGNISPAILSSINAAISMANASAQQNDPSFDFRKNLIGNLGDDFVGYQKAAAGNSAADLNNAPSIFLFAAVNPDQALQAVRSVASMMYGRQGGTDPRDFLGKKIYSIALPAARLPGATTAAPRYLYLTASSGYVAVSTDSSILENFLRSTGSPAKPLRETAGLADAAQHIGGTGTGLFGYENQREIMRSAFTLLKNQSASNGGLDSMAALPKSFRDWMDFSLLPDYDAVSKYFYFSVFNGGTTTDGISFKVFAPRPPQLN
jgi:hypothetical protein